MKKKCYNCKCKKHLKKDNAYFKSSIVNFLKAYDKITLIKNDSSENKDLYCQVLKAFEELKLNKNNIDTIDCILKNTVNPLTLKIQNI